MTVPDELRNRLADLHLGAPVHSSDDRHIGSLRRVVVDQDSWEPRAVVVRETARFNGHLLALAAGLMTEELIVPMSAIARASRERVDLSITASEARHLPPYLSYAMAPLTGTDTAVNDLAILVGGATLPREVESAAKAAGDIEIRVDENVMLNHEGERFGRVRDVLLDGGELVGVVVHPDGMFEEDVLVQLRFLERSDDGALFLHMTRADLENLSPFHPES
ncbi:MAG TPA: hypothetical protein VH134_01420 [Candidatus Dormibacteraeota bacterium]|jgi:sporulation protein YlmC with PRC-barrel domain|nr:hypothetical protein [Candidatus Dormibacteraeota bacterium]